MISKLRGTKDILSDHARVWSSVLSSSTELFIRYGYSLIQTPLIEEAELFSRSVGEVTDIVQKEMYSFQDRSGNEIALRPEGTAGVVRAFIENNLGKDGIVEKLFYYGPMFRAERPQKGRQRQFHQLGAEVIGTNSLYADVELIHLCCELLTELGITGYEVRLNTLGKAEHRKEYIKVLVEYFRSNQNELNDMERERLDKNPLRILDSKNPKIAGLIKNAPMLSDYLDDCSMKRFQDIVELLKDLNVPVVVSPRIIRGLDYYTDTVFEITHAGLGSQDAIAAGGRYDDLVATLGGKPTPAVGFGLGIERILLTLESLKAPITNQGKDIDVAVVTLGEDAKPVGLKLATQLRRVSIKTSFEAEERSLKSQLRQANRFNARIAAIIGEEEIKNKSVQLKVLNKELPDCHEPIANQVCVEKIKELLKHNVSIA